VRKKYCSLADKACLRSPIQPDSNRLTSLETTFGCSRQNQSIHSPSEGSSRRRMLTAIWSSAHEETACLCSRFFSFWRIDAFWRGPWLLWREAAHVFGANREGKAQGDRLRRPACSSVGRPSSRCSASSRACLGAQVLRFQVTLIWFLFDLPSDSFYCLGFDSMENLHDWDGKSASKLNLDI